ncbi:MAG: hypothetical protein HY789_08390 [Deltaproteobacteria bacterium]|nr:hypothetical protein [Deltaproteobacteria bacterium]
MTVHEIFSRVQPAQFNIQHPPAFWWSTYSLTTAAANLLVDLFSASGTMDAFAA